jgi:Fe-S-cluster-containing dehydrogenase component
MILNDMSLCIGCYKCIDACPYGVRSIDPFVKLTLPNREKDLGDCAGMREYLRRQGKSIR